MFEPRLGQWDFEMKRSAQVETKTPSLGSRAIDVSGGGRLVLRRIRIINGAADWGGGLLVQGAGSSLLMEQVSVRNCVATGPKMSSFSHNFGGGRLACSFICAPGQRLAHSAFFTPLL